MTVSQSILSSRSAQRLVSFYFWDTQRHSNEEFLFHPEEFQASDRWDWSSGYGMFMNKERNEMEGKGREVTLKEVK
jgi:hypothetical protein